MAAAAALLAISAPGAIAAEAAPQAPPECGAPASLLTIEPALTHFVARLRRHQQVKIVAVGSSSTEGIGASGPAQTYPSRLEVELERRLPDTPVRVINRGKGGEEVPDMLLRLDRDVIAEHPDLAIWQLGTNAVLRQDDVSQDAELIREGIDRLHRTGSDVVLMDMQYAPRVLARPAYAAMARLIATVAKRAGVGLFRRFDIMHHWQAAQPAAAAAMIGPDGLHMTDRGYGCIAADLADAIVANWREAEHAPVVAVAVAKVVVAGQRAPDRAAAAQPPAP